jgi:hypothetical protein
VVNQCTADHLGFTAGLMSSAKAGNTLPQNWTENALFYMWEAIS